MGAFAVVESAEHRKNMGRGRGKGGGFCGSLCKCMCITFFIFSIMIIVPAIMMIFSVVGGADDCGCIDGDQSFGKLASNTAKVYQKCQRLDTALTCYFACAV